MGAVAQLQSTVLTALDTLKSQGKWNPAWDDVVVNMQECVQKSIGLDHVTFQHCNDIAPEGIERLEPIKSKAQAVMQTTPMFRVLGFAISPKVAALQVATGAGAGNRYEETVYATPSMSSCVAVRYFIHYVAIENFPDDTVKAFDQEALLNQFDQIRRTLTIGQ